MYRASKALEAFILRSAPAHVATPDAPSTWEALQRYQGAAVLPVYDGASDRTIYSTPAVNHAFRAWHDGIHLALGAGFDRAGERATAIEHVRQARAAGLSSEDCAALWADTWGQFDHAEHNGGAFPENQASFVAHYLAERTLAV